MKRAHGFPWFLQPEIPALTKKKRNPKTAFNWPLMSLSPSMHLAAPNQNLPGHCNLDTIDQHCSDLNFKQPAILIPLSPSSESKHYGFIGKKALATHLICTNFAYVKRQSIQIELILINLNMLMKRVGSFHEQISRATYTKISALLITCAHIQ